MSERVIIKIEDKWYDLTSYLDQHPGGIEEIRKYSGKDATENFNRVSAHKFVKTFIKNILKENESNEPQF